VAYFDSVDSSSYAGVYVCDALGEKCIREGHDLGTCSSGARYLNPVDVEVDADGYLYVADRGASEVGHKRIVKLAPVPAE